MKEEIRCPECNSSHVYNRSMQRNYRCVKCGNIFKKEDIKKNVLQKAKKNKR